MPVKVNQVSFTLSQETKSDVTYPNGTKKIKQKKWRKKVHKIQQNIPVEDAVTCHLVPLNEGLTTPSCSE